MTLVYKCKRCDLTMVERPTREKGRCPECGNKLYPNGYYETYEPDPVYRFYPAPSWEEDLR